VPGNDALAPNADPARDYVGAYLALGCQLFGVPDDPGCLTRILSTYFPSRPAAPTTTATPHKPTTPARTTTAPPPAMTTTGPGKPLLPSLPANPVQTLTCTVKSLLGYLLKR
jgi:hypothetical protein